MDLSIRDIIDEAIRPGHFYVGSRLELRWQHVESESLPWEIFRGRLLDPRHTREQRSFEAWNIYEINQGSLADEPLVAVKWDAAAAEVHITRGILCYVQEGYHAGDNVYLTREAVRWTRELVQTIQLADVPGEQPEHWLRWALYGGLRNAVRGQSRLPLTSLEAPLPWFSLGELDYVELAPAGDSPLPTLAWLLRHDMPLHCESFLETALRSSEPVPQWTAAFLDRAGISGQKLLATLAQVLNGVSLLPWTAFVDRMLLFLQELLRLRAITPGEYADFIAGSLQKLCRHLTAYDLETFHYRGANYPDALLLDALLQELLDFAGMQPTLFLDDGAEAEAKARRRRALRMGWLVRRHYEGHPVPDEPTSPGENQRVLPPPYRRVPEEQILNVLKRKKKLYADDSLPEEVADPLAFVLRQAARDLTQPSELRELGMALFIDRPFGVLHGATEPDHTPLFSYLAFSRSIARRRLEALAREPAFPSVRRELKTLQESLESLEVPGLDASVIPEETRPVVSLADTRKVAEDFVLLRSFGGIQQRLINRQADLPENHASLIVRGPRSDGGAEVHVYDEAKQLRLVLAVDQASRER